MTAYRRVGATAITGLVLAVLPTAPADADGAVQRLEQSTDVYCATAAGDWTIQAGVNRNVAADGVQTYAFAAVYDEAGTVDAYGETADIVFEDGHIDATVQLTDHEDVAFGEAHLVGSYVVGESMTTRGRPLKMLGNQYMVQTTTLAPVAVTWDSLDVAGVELVTDGTIVVDPGCDGYDMIRDDIITNPDRLSFPVEEYAVVGSCAAGSLTEISVVPSEGGLSLILFGADGLFGETNLDVTQTGPQLLQWWLPGAEEPLVAEITVGFDSAGSPRTSVLTEQGQTIRSTVRPLAMTFTAGLPDGTTAAATCDVDHITTRVVVEPIETLRRS
jgi:hypothetical protein